jgi:hypothetical protein
VRDFEWPFHLWHEVGTRKITPQNWKMVGVVPSFFPIFALGVKVSLCRCLAMHFGTVANITRKTDIKFCLQCVKCDKYYKCQQFNLLKRPHTFILKAYFDF